MVVEHTSPGAASTFPIVYSRRRVEYMARSVQDSNLLTGNFDFHTQYSYSGEYWEHQNKLGHSYYDIDWQACSLTRKQLPLSQQLWSTKWITNWLPVGKNMLRWNHWTTDRSPSCTMAIEDTSHLIDCQEIGRQAYLSQLITQVEQNLINQHVPPLAVTTMLHAFFPYCTQVQGLTPMMLQLQHMQTHLNEHKWGLPLLHWRSSLKQFILDPTKAHVTR